MKFVRMRAIAGAAVLGLALAACGSDESGDAATEVDTEAEFAEGSTMAELNEAGSITIGTKFDQPLFGLRGPSGDPEGFDVEIGKIIAAKLGIEPGDIEWVETVTENREPFIQEGRVDLVIATYTINDDRKELVDFAGPYFVAGQTLMVLEDNNEITGPDDLAGATVCSARASTPAENISENYPDANLELAAAYGDCLEPLRNGQVDALTTDNVILSGYVDQNEGEFKLVGDPFTEEPYGIGLELGDDEFRDWINDALEESYEDGSWEEAWNRTAGAVLDLPEPPAVDRY